MSIDMAQFHQVFFEESFEGLDIMESGLLNLDMGDVDSEVINTIFRAAHSIKGGSGTFGFTAVSDFTHVMETLLDEMRDGRRQITQAAVDVLLGSVDCLREMLSAIQDENDIDEVSVAEHKKNPDSIISKPSKLSSKKTW
jgi:two-component system chemotaxis sensor kinase CheA